MVAAITLNPTHAKVGTSVLITGSAFNPGDTVTFTYGGNPIVATEAPIVVAGDGTLPTCHIVIPASIEGVHIVEASDASLNVADANFTVDSFISLDNASGNVGDTVIITGIGFDGTVTVTFTYAGSSIIPTDAPITSDADGGFTATIVIPASIAGANTIEATDASMNVADTDFTVDPFISINPTDSVAGDPIDVTGTGFATLSLITLTIGGIDVTPVTHITDATGGFTFIGIIVPDLPEGNETVSATDEDLNNATTTLTEDSSLSVSPTSGRIGSTATLTAHGLAANSAITVDFGGIDVTPAGSPTSDASGDYSGDITIPTITSGLKTITLTDASANAPTATFTVSAVTLVRSPTSGPVGTVVTLTGANYVPSATLTITNTDAATTTVTATSGGDIPASTTITIESTEIGAQNITVSDGTNTGTVSFTITQLITIDPQSGPANTEVLITGTGFAGTSVVGVKVDGVTVVTAPSTITTDSDGAFVATTTLAGLADGAHTILCTDASLNAYSAIFTVSATLALYSVPNDLNVDRVYKWNENVELEADDTSYTDAVVLDVRNVAQLLLTIYNSGGQTMKFETLGIIHESDHYPPQYDAEHKIICTPPSTDSTGIKQWVPIDTDVSLATTVIGSKYYQDFLWSYILVRVKLAGSTAATTCLFNCKTIDKNG